MKLIGLMPVRNESWIIGLSARVALMWVDELIVLAHACTDTTVEILHGIQQENAGLHIFLERDGEWREMEHRQRLLKIAREHRASHIALIDADEILTANLLLPTIRGIIESAPLGSILQIPGYNMRGGITRYHTNGIWGQRIFSIAFRDDPRLLWGGDGFHKREPWGAPLAGWRPITQGNGGVMHLWGADLRRLRAKHALYKMVEAVRWPDKPRALVDREYSQAFYPQANLHFAQSWEYATAPRDWWDGYAHLLKWIRVDDVPWQEAECRRLWYACGPDKFKGLDLFGVITVSEIASMAKRSKAGPGEARAPTGAKGEHGS